MHDNMYSSGHTTAERGGGGGGGGGGVRVVQNMGHLHTMCVHTIRVKLGKEEGGHRARNGKSKGGGGDREGGKEGGRERGREGERMGKLG